MEGEQYSKWGVDDTILYHIICARHKLQYKPFVEPEFIDEAIVYRDEATREMKCDHIKIPNPKYTGEEVKLEYVPIPKGEARLQEDNRSVHNEADIQKIQSLQEQLDSQALKLKTITDMLIGKGLV
jgi:predicted HAD superfamily phosphohydrolase